LREFARAYAAVLGSPYSMPSLRLLISQVGRSNLAESVQQDSQLDPWPPVQALLGEQVDAGVLTGAPAAKITGQLRALICGGLPYLQLVGAVSVVTPEALQASADEAVDLILQAYLAPSAH
jgi:hypothetical protein